MHGALKFAAGSSMLDSMWTSMASSMQLAEECLKSEDVGDEPDFSSQEPLSGLEHCAQTIDASKCWSLEDNCFV